LRHLTLCECSLDVLFDLHGRYPAVTRLCFLRMTQSGIATWKEIRKWYVLARASG
jgi:hypothetical protein